MHSHISTSKERQLTCEHSQEPRDGIELCGRAEEKEKMEISALVIKHLELFDAVFSF